MCHDNNLSVDNFPSTFTICCKTSDATIEEKIGCPFVLTIISVYSILGYWLQSRIESSKTIRPRAIKLEYNKREQVGPKKLVHCAVRGVTRRLCWAKRCHKHRFWIKPLNKLHKATVVTSFEETIVTGLVVSKCEKQAALPQQTWESSRPRLDATDRYLFSLFS